MGGVLKGLMEWNVMVLHWVDGIDGMERDGSALG
jgi:hypothetical protein